MKIAYNPITSEALSTAPENNDITFDLRGLNIFVKGVRFRGTDTTYSVFKKHTSSSGGGYDGLVPVPSYTSTNIRFLREDGTWQVPIDNKVLLSETTTTNYRPVVLGYNNSTSTSDLSNNITEQVYTTTTIYVLPSTGSLWANKLYSGGKAVITDHQSLSNYVTINTTLNITGLKTFTNPINNSYSTNTYLAGNLGKALINSTAGAGAYVMLFKGNSTNGYFTHGVYQGSYLLQYTAKSTVDAGTNAVTKSITLLDEFGNSYFPGNIGASKFIGALLGNADSATKLTTSAGSATRPIYFVDGKPVAGTYTFGNANGNAAINNGTLNSNLNADMLDGLHSSYFLTKAGVNNNGGTGYVTNDTHIMQLGYMICSSAHDSLTLLFQSAFWGNLHGSSDIIWLCLDLNTNGAQAVQVSACRLKIGYRNNSRVFYYKIDSTNKRVYLYVYVTGGNSYGRWISLIISSSNPNMWVSEIKFNLPNTGLTTIQERFEFESVYSATRLSTPRQINGTNFDGTANITTSYWGTTRTLTIGNSAKSVNGSRNVSWSLSEIGAASSSHTHPLSLISDLHSSWDVLLKVAPSAYVTRWPTISEVTSKLNLVIKLNWGTTEGTNLFTYNVTTAKTINITASSIGAASSSHTHSYVSSLGVSGNYITWTRDNNTLSIIVPYASNSDTVDGLHANSFMRAVNANGYYGMASPDGSTSTWIRTTSSGILPYLNGNSSSGHCGIGTSTWYFSSAYILNIYSSRMEASSGFYQLSDIRLKENIQKITSMSNIELVEFVWKKDKKKSYGVIALQVEKYFPELVNIDKETGYKSVNYDAILIIKIALLENKIKQLESKLL